MFETREPGLVPGNTVQDREAEPAVTVEPRPVPPEQVPPEPVPPEPVPLERLEAQICELAGHLAAAECRFLRLLGDFDARKGWASWDMRSCAQWLSWKCQMSPGTAREHVRVARALRELPVITAGFAAGRLSYSKVRALTRIADAQTEEGLVELALPMTASQLDRFARAHRQVSDRSCSRHCGPPSATWNTRTTPPRKTFPRERPDRARTSRARTSRGRTSRGRTSRGRTSRGRTAGRMRTARWGRRIRGAWPMRW